MRMENKLTAQQIQSTLNHLQLPEARPPLTLGMTGTVVFNNSTVISVPSSTRFGLNTLDSVINSDCSKTDNQIDNKLIRLETRPGTFDGQSNLTVPLPCAVVYSVSRCNERETCCFSVCDKRDNVKQNSFFSNCDDNDIYYKDPSIQLNPDGMISALRLTPNYEPCANTPMVVIDDCGDGKHFAVKTVGSTEMPLLIKTNNANNVSLDVDHFVLQDNDEQHCGNLRSEESQIVKVDIEQEKIRSYHSVKSTGSGTIQSSVGKRNRNLAKKVQPMFPGAKWRKLRNTLKATQEMQAPMKKQTLSREDSFLRKFSTRNQRLHSSTFSGSEGSTGDFQHSPSSGMTSKNSTNLRLFKPPRNFAVQHDGNFMFKWLGIVTLAVQYNLWTCILREAFCEVQRASHTCWFCLDVFFDMIYLLDILVQFRTGYLDQGLMVYDSKKLAKRYIKSRKLYIDALCLVPLDFLQFYTGVHPMIRFPRFLKVYRTFLFIHMLESRTAYPNLIRVTNLTHILFLGAHWFAAFYYLISEAEDFKGSWSYPNPVGEYAMVSRKYLASLFWSTLTLTTIGDLPPPDNGKDFGMSNAAYVFVIVSYLIGVFVFATIVGQVGNVINNKNARRQEFERLLDGAKVYMQTHSVPSEFQKRVQRWYDYVWSRGRLNGCDINSLGLLPDKLKTELAIHVNLETLKKVTIFQECLPEFLHDLVLKMKAYIFTPGDLICGRGEVAREMFIIADGLVEIISESGTVLKQMATGDFFGEIGILNLDGGINRRTADVRSVGYSELFVLSRDDVLVALKDHPDAESIIRDYGQRRLREIEAHRQLVKPIKQLDASTCRLSSKRVMDISVQDVASTVGFEDVLQKDSRRHNKPIVDRMFACPCMRQRHIRTNKRGHLASWRKGFFRSFCCYVRQIFCRKVSRQKSKEEQTIVGTTDVEDKMAWMNKNTLPIIFTDTQHSDSSSEHSDQHSRNVRQMCCSLQNSNLCNIEQDYVSVQISESVEFSETIPSRKTPSICIPPSLSTNVSKPIHTVAVLTEEDDNSRYSSPIQSFQQIFIDLGVVKQICNEGEINDVIESTQQSSPQANGLGVSKHSANINVLNVEDSFREQNPHILSSATDKDVFICTSRLNAKFSEDRFVPKKDEIIGGKEEISTPQICVRRSCNLALRQRLCEQCNDIGSEKRSPDCLQRRKSDSELAITKRVLIRHNTPHLSHCLQRDIQEIPISCIDNDHVSFFNSMGVIDDEYALKCPKQHTYLHCEHLNQSSNRNMSTRIPYIYSLHRSGLDQRRRANSFPGAVEDCQLIPCLQRSFCYAKDVSSLDFSSAIKNVDPFNCSKRFNHSERLEKNHPVQDANCTKPEQRQDTDMCHVMSLLLHLQTTQMQLLSRMENLESLCSIHIAKLEELVRFNARMMTLVNDKISSAIEQPTSGKDGIWNDRDVTPNP